MNLSISTAQSRKIQVAVKALLTLVSIYFVYTQVPFREILTTLKNVHLFFFFLAFLMFNISKVVSAFRLNRFYREIGLLINEWFNLKLYYLGMFYNLFLPGSIGGDGYKVYLLRQYSGQPTRLIASATLLDRLSGLAVLSVLTAVFVLNSEFATLSPFIFWIAGVGGGLGLPCYYLLVRLAFHRFLSAFVFTTHLSFWVQIGQVACASFLLQSLSVESHYFGYLTLFMLSSVVAVLPISIGGVGIRELVFLYGIRFLDVEEHQAIAFSILFFAVIAISSIIGLCVIPFIRRDSSH